MTEENITGVWVPVSDCLPSVSGRYWIQSTIGSIAPRPRTRLAKGKMTPTGFRFFLRDWEVATAWLKETPGTGAKFMGDGSRKEEEV